MDVDPRSPMADTAYERLKRDILDNVLQPGFQALESGLAARLGMSRTPVREALLRLQAEGLVEVIPRRGMRVLPLSPDDMREIYQVLACVESEAAALLAASRPSGDTLTPLADATTRMEAALDRDDLDAWAAADADYHRALTNLCPNRRFAVIARTYQDQAYRVRMFTLRLRERPHRSTADHREQVSAILSGDADTVRANYRSHRERAGAELLRILERFRLHNL